ncbi:hypothetical protein [Desulfosarcina cetonica]|uniref:hypothetical protein n=1 Tax=Desulfosarcina cetonica TaxID=90730 RepID=UPI001FEF817B|nr:hypothetical protein [Desulfosarcina cetonica]
MKLPILFSLISMVSRSSIFDVVPDGRFDLDRRFVLGAADTDRLARDARDGSDLSIEIALLGRRIVAHEHHLGAFFQRQGSGRGKGLRGKVAFDFGVKCKRFLFDGRKARRIDGIGIAVVGAQGDIPGIVVRREPRDVTGIEGRQRGCIDPGVAHPVEQVDKTVIGLAVDPGQFDGHQFGLLQGAAAEEIG